MRRIPEICASGVEYLWLFETAIWWNRVPVLNSVYIMARRDAELTAAPSGGKTGSGIQYGWSE